MSLIQSEELVIQLQISLRDADKSSLLTVCQEGILTRIICLT